MLLLSAIILFCDGVHSKKSLSGMKRALRNSRVRLMSEDFEMALRLQVYGYLVRMAAWAGDGFKEGVSLTVYDELTR